MKPFLTALVSALTGLAVALLGLVVVAIPAVLLWLVTFEARPEPLVVAAGAAGAWLLGHGVPLEFHFSAQTALGMGAAPEAVLYPLSLPLLGLTVLSVWGGFQNGWRSATRRWYALAGTLGGTAGFTLVTTGAYALARPLLGADTWYAIGRPALLFLLASTIGAVARGIHTHRLWQRLVVDPLSARPRTQYLAELFVRAARLAAATFAGLVTAVAVLIALTLVLRFADIVALSETLQLDIVGTVVMAIAQLLLLPVMLLWGLAWLSGAGFSVGAATTLSPFDHLLGPLPVFPLFGALPDAWHGWAALAPTLLVVVVIVIGALAGDAPFWRELPWWQAIALAIVAAALLGAGQGVLNGFGIGAIGPARLQVSGPQPWIAAGVLAAEVAIGLSLGILARRLDRYWLDPLGDTVASKRAAAKAARAREWAQLGRPETFGQSDGGAGARDGASGAKDSDSGVDASAETVPYPTETLGTVRKTDGATITENIVFGRTAGAERDSADDPETAHGSDNTDRGETRGGFAGADDPDFAAENADYGAAENADYGAAENADQAAAENADHGAASETGPGASAEAQRRQREWFDELHAPPAPKPPRQKTAEELEAEAIEKAFAWDAPGGYGSSHRATDQAVRSALAGDAERSSGGGSRFGRDTGSRSGSDTDGDSERNTDRGRAAKRSAKRPWLRGFGRQGSKGSDRDGADPHP